MLPVKFHLQGQNFQLQINDLKIHHLWFDYFNDTPERFILVRFQQHQTTTVIIREKVQYRQIIRKILMDHLNTLIPLLYISHLVIINYIHDVDKQPLCKGNLFPAIFMQILQIWFCFLQTILQDQTFCHISIKSIHIKIILFILLFCLQNLISF